MEARELIAQRLYSDACEFFGFDSSGSPTEGAWSRFLTRAEAIIKDLSDNGAYIVELDEKAITPTDRGGVPLGGEPGSMARAFNEAEGDRSE